MITSDTKTLVPAPTAPDITLPTMATDMDLAAPLNDIVSRIIGMIKSLGSQGLGLTHAMRLQMKC